MLVVRRLVGSILLLSVLGHSLLRNILPRGIPSRRLCVPQDSEPSLSTDSEPGDTEVIESREISRLERKIEELRKSITETVETRKEVEEEFKKLDEESVRPRLIESTHATASRGRLAVLLALYALLPSLRQDLPSHPVLLL